MSVLKIDVLREAIKSIPEDPFEKFANKHGFSLLAGDKLILPKSIEKDIGTHLGIIYSRFVDDAYYLINPKKVGLGFTPHKG